jgi:hypothetical protein
MVDNPRAQVRQKNYEVCDLATFSPDSHMKGRCWRLLPLSVTADGAEDAPKRISRNSGFVVLKAGGLGVGIGKAGTTATASAAAAASTASNVYFFSALR